MKFKKLFSFCVSKIIFSLFLSLFLVSGNIYTCVGFPHKVLNVSEAPLICLFFSLYPHELIISIAPSLMSSILSSASQNLCKCIEFFNALSTQNFYLIHSYGFYFSNCFVNTTIFSYSYLNIALNILYINIYL